VNDPGQNAHKQKSSQDRRPALGRGRWLSEPLRGLFDERVQRRILDAVSLSAAVLLTGEGVYIWYANKPIGPVLQVALFLGLLGFLSVPWVVRATNSAASGALIVLIALAGLIVVPAYYQGGTSALFTMWFLLVPLLGGIFLGQRIALVMGLLGVAVMTGLFTLESLGKLPDSSGVMDPLPAWLNLVSAIGFSALVGAISAKTLVNFADRLQAASLADAAKARALEAIARVGSDGRFQTVNLAFAAMHGSDAEDLVGSAANDWIVEEDRAQVVVAVADLAQSGRQDVTVRGQKGDGTSFFENLFMITIPNEEPGEHYRFARDVTRQRALTAQLTQSMKMDAIGRLAGGIAHDFNNLLMTILAASDRLNDSVSGLPDPNPGREYLGWINTAAQRGASLTRQLLDFSHMQSSEPGLIDINQSLRRLIRMLDPVLGTSIQVESELHPGPLVTVGDLGRFESGLMNLAVNARDAISDSGTLRFRSSECRLDHSEPRFAAFNLESDRFVCVEVVDDGAGIDSEILGDIFDPFFTTKPVGKGTGLGLSLLYTYTREVGGALEIASEPGVGTRVTIFLPYSDESPLAVEEPVTSRATGNETVLLAEDEVIVAELLSVLLREAGFQVMSCADGREAVETFQKYREKIDVVLLDYRMPELNGIEVFNSIHRTEPDLPVILMSGNIAGAEIRDLEARGIREVLRKPCSGSDVLHSVRSAIDANE
jgi:PAS domain S-box-containing protein